MSFTNRPMVSANNIDQELGWCKTDFKKIGVDYSYFRSLRENDFYPHYIHNLDNLLRPGGVGLWMGLRRVARSGGIKLGRRPARVRVPGSRQVHLGASRARRRPRCRWSSAT